MTSPANLRIVSIEDLEIVDTLAVLGAVPSHKVVSHFGEVLFRGGFIKCWLYSKFWVPIGWDVAIWRAE